jgi:hypothetical protein
MKELEGYLITFVCAGLLIMILSVFGCVQQSMAPSQGPIAPPIIPYPASIPTQAQCTGFHVGDALFTVPDTGVYTKTIPLHPNSRAWPFQIQDGYTLRICNDGETEFYPGIGEQQHYLLPGETVALYILSADFSMIISETTPGNAVGADMRIALYNTDAQVLEPGTASDGSNPYDANNPGLIPEPVGIFNFGDTVGGPPGLVLNAFSTTSQIISATRDFGNNPMILYFVIPKTWTGHYLIGPALMFNGGQNSTVTYIYHISGLVEVLK